MPCYTKKCLTALSPRDSMLIILRGIVMRQLEIDNEIKGRLSLLCVMMSIHSADGMFSIHRVAENVFRDLLNIVYPDAFFVNANLAQPNAPGLDLVSHNKKMIVQVTTENTKKKIEKTIEKCDLEKYKGYRLVILLVVERKIAVRCLTKKVSYLKFTLKEDVWDIKTISRLLGNLSVDDLERAKLLLEKSVGFSPPCDENESALEQIIQIFSKEDRHDDADDEVGLPFGIDKKINHNALDMRYSLISDRFGSSAVVNRVYERYEQEGENKRKSVIGAIRREYLLLADEIRGVDLYDKLLDNIVNRISYATGLLEIKREDVIRYCELLMVDAFVKCKIFKKP